MSAFAGAAIPCRAARSAIAPLSCAISVGLPFIRSWSIDARCEPDADGSNCAFITRSAAAVSTATPSASATAAISPRTLSASASKSSYLASADTGIEPIEHTVFITQLNATFAQITAIASAVTRVGMPAAFSAAPASSGGRAAGRRDRAEHRLTRAERGDVAGTDKLRAVHRDAREQPLVRRVRAQRLDVAEAVLQREQQRGGPDGAAAAAAATAAVPVAFANTMTRSAGTSGAGTAWRAPGQPWCPTHR